MKSEKHDDIIRHEFTKQAGNFGKEGLTLSNKEYLAWAVQNLALGSEDKVLDVAAGTGHLSRAVAPYVREVWAVDTTPAMIEQGLAEARKQNITNINYIQGIAEELPFEDESFDLVMSRLAFHHFVDSREPLQEMIRVCKQHGTIVVMDLLSPDEGSLLEIYNHLERLRDPSHTYALTSEGFKNMLLEAGLQVAEFQLRDIEVNLKPWLELTSTPEDSSTIITKELTAELDGENKTGMRPFRKEGEIRFLQTWALIIAKK